MALAEPVPAAYLDSDAQGKYEVSLDDVLVSSPARAVENNAETAEDTKTEEAEMDMFRYRVFASAGPAAWTTRRDGEVKLRMEEHGIGSEEPKTVHALLDEAVKKYGNRYALAYKKNGRWMRMSYKRYYEECWTAAKSFLKLGLERFHGVCILGFNSAEWFIADIGAILAGGLAVGIYTTSSPEACHYIAENSSANIIVVENHKQLQKILEIEHKLPHLKAIIMYGEEPKEKRPNLYSWAEFIKLSDQVADSNLLDIVESQKPNQCCTLIYTSGTTGQPKGVMLSHDNLTWTAAAAGSFIQLSEALDKQELVVSYLPLSHIAAQMIDIWLPLTFGAQVFFAQPDALKLSQDELTKRLAARSSLVSDLTLVFCFNGMVEQRGTLVDTLREVRPTSFLGVPRVWEKMEEKMKYVGAKSSALKRKVASWAKEVGLQTNLKQMNGNTQVPVNFRLARRLVYKRVRKALGLDRCRRCYTGAAPITRETLEFFLSLNIPVYELYGMSECSGPHTISLPHAFKLTSCGKEITGCRTLIHKPDAEGNGEICFSGRHVFMGYLNMDAKTKEAIDKDGWLHSGDLGKHDKDGFLYITGRIKELIITAGGENIPPVPIEDAVKEAVPIISNAMLVGDKAKFLAMLLTLKCQVNEESGEPGDELTPEAIEYCHKLGSKATRISEIIRSKDQAVYAAIQKGISAVNERAVSNAQKVQKWALLEKDFSIFGGELGPTMKLKRAVVAQKYKEQIERFYTDAETPTTTESSAQK